MLRQDLNWTRLGLVTMSLALVGHSLLSCKATDLNGLLEDDPAATALPRNRADDFQQISSLISAAMHMIPYNIEETHREHSYMESAREAAAECQAPAQGQALSPECTERLFQLFGDYKGLKHASFAQFFLLDANNSFKNSLESRVMRQTWDFLAFPAGTAEEQAIATAEGQLSAELQRMALADLTLLPTVHFDPSGEPVCFSYSIKIRPLPEAATVSVAIPAVDEPNAVTYTTSGEFQQLDVNSWIFDYGQSDPGPMDPGLYQNRFFAGQFSEPFEANDHLKFGVIGRSYGKSLEIRKGNLGNDGVKSLDCPQGEGACTFLVGEPRPAGQSCPLFRLAR